MTLPHCPEQNGVAERKNNRALMEMAHYMMAHAGSWAEAVDPAVYIINRTRTSSIKKHKTLYQMWKLNI